MGTKKTPDLEILKVDLTKNKSAYVREILASEQRKINKAAFRKDDEGNVIGVDNEEYNYHLALYSLCDQNGKSLYGENDIPKMESDYSATDMTLIQTAAIHVNRLNEDLETIAKKS